MAAEEVDDDDRWLYGDEGKARHSSELAQKTRSLLEGARGVTPVPDDLTEQETEELLLGEGGENGR